MAPRIQKTRIVQTDHGTFALIDGSGRVIRGDFRSKALAAMWGTRQKLYQGSGPPRRKPAIPPNLEDESIKPIPLLSRMSGDSYPTFLADAKAGRYGELYRLANGFGLKFGNWKRGMAARVINKVAAE